MLRPFPDSLISSPYGWRSLAGGTFHEGVDYAVGIGTPLRAIADGTVVDVGETKKFGRFVVVARDGGGYFRWHAISQSLKGVGERVEEGEPIALSGATGFWTTGPHAHLQTTTALDPATHFNPLSALAGGDATPFEEEDLLSDDQFNYLKAAIENVAAILAVDDNGGMRARLSEVKAAIADTHAAVNNLTNIVAVDNGGGIRAQVDKLAKAGVDVKALAQAIVAELPPGVVTPEAVVDELAKRLAS